MRGGGVEVKGTAVNSASYFFLSENESIATYSSKQYKVYIRYKYHYSAAAINICYTAVTLYMPLDNSMSAFTRGSPTNDTAALFGLLAPADRRKPAQETQTHRLSHRP